VSKTLKLVFTACIMLLFSNDSFAVTRLYDSSGDLEGRYYEAACDAEMSCSLSGRRLSFSLSGLQSQVSATATTIVASQCGNTFLNTGAVVINLPEASAVLGCQLTFITGNASNFDVNPDDADQILVLTNAAGDAIRNATLGNSVVLEAISASEWAPVGGEQGTWTDIN